MTKNNLKNYITISILTVIFTVFSCIPAGIFSLIFPALLAGLLGYTTTRHHFVFVGFVCVCIIAPCIIILQDALAAIYGCAEIILYGLALGISFNLKLSGIKTMGILAAIHVIYTVLSMVMLDIGSDFVSVITESVQSLYPLYEGYLSQADFNALMTTTVTLLTKFIPCFFVVAGLFVSLVYFGVFVFVLKITKITTHYGKFYDCHADKSISIIYFVLSFISFIMPAESYYSDVVSNVILITTFVFFFFGLSYVAFWIKKSIKRTMTQKLLFALAIISPVFVFGLPFMVIAYIGALDGIFDFRQKTSDKNLTDRS